MNTTTESTATRSFLAVLLVGVAAGVLAGIGMLVTMGLLRLAFGWPTPTELIFDRLFPFLTVEFFIGPLVKPGGYTPLKLQGVYGALAGQVAVAAIGGVIYSWYLDRRDRRQRSDNAHHGIVDARGWRLIVPGVLVASGMFVILLWPTLITNYHELPPARARIFASLGMLISFSVCGFGIMFFHALLSARPAQSRTEPAGISATGRRRFFALGIGAALAVALNGLLRQLYRIGTFAYDGRQYRGPDVQKITPIRPRDEFCQVSKNLIDPMIVRDSWRLDIVGQVENPQVYSFADIAAMPAVEQETTLLCISYGIGSGLCSNAIWKGVPLPSLLAQVKPKPNITTVRFRAADGYYETFRFEKAMKPTTLVAYEMNGEPLPQGHGFPLRDIVPGLYGEKNPKWLTRIELLDEADARLHRRHGCGFYKQQGWGRLGDVVPTHSRFDAPQVAGDHFAQPFILGKTAELRGMALGGDRGISKIEISTDDGQTWEEAEISAARHKNFLESVALRVDAEGSRQIAARGSRHRWRWKTTDQRISRSGTDGATRLHRVRANVVTS